MIRTRRCQSRVVNCLSVIVRPRAQEAHQRSIANDGQIRAWGPKNYWVPSRIADHTPGGGRPRQGSLRVGMRCTVLTLNAIAIRRIQRERTSRHRCVEQ